MKIIVGKHDIRVVNEAINEKELNITNCTFEFDDDITSEYNKQAYFTKGNDTYKMIILDDACDIPDEILQSEGKVEIGVSYFKIEDNETIRYNPTPAYFYVLEGSIKDKTKNGLVIKTPSELEQFEDEIEDYIKTLNIDIDVSKEGNATTVTATNANGEHHTSIIYDGVDGEQGPAGKDGKDGVDGKDGKDGKDGQDGQNGQDGFSPIITTNKVDKTTTITITDADGTKTATILDGQDGQNGQDGRDGTDGRDGQDGTDGTNGTDGFSPVANVSKTGNTATITITDAVGTTSTTISDGTNGTNGTDGQDGYSPSASVTKSGNTATISITDKNGTTTATVSDGTNGTDGYTPVKGVDYFTQQDIASLNIPDDLGDLTNNAGYIKNLFLAEYGVTTWADVKSAIDNNKVVYCKVASSGSYRMAFLAFYGSSSAEFQYYRSVSSHTATQQGDQVFVYKISSNSSWSTETREAASKIVAGTNMTSSYSNGTLTLNASGGSSLSAGKFLTIDNNVIDYNTSTNVSLDASTNIGDNTNRRLDFNSLKCGRTFMKNSSWLNANFYYKYTYNNTEYTNSFQIEDGTGKSFHYTGYDIELFKDINDLANVADYTIVGIITFYKEIWSANTGYGRNSNTVTVFIEKGDGTSYSPYLHLYANASSVSGTEVELNSNKVTSISSSSTNTQYPSAKCVYDAIYGALNNNY